MNNYNPCDTYQNYDWLYEQYITKRKRIYEIAKELDRTHDTITRWLRKFNIPIRNSHEYDKPKSWHNREFLYTEYVLNQKTSYQIADEVSSVSSSVLRKLKEFDIPVRTIYESRVVNGSLIGDKTPNWKGGICKIRADPAYKTLHGYTLRDSTLSNNILASSYQGVYVAENKIADRLLQIKYQLVEHMPWRNPGFDFLCNGSIKVDVKSSCTRNDKFWEFSIGENTIPDYFCCIAFNNKLELNVEHIWWVPSSKVNKHAYLRIQLGRRGLNKWKSFEISSNLNTNFDNIKFLFH